MTKYIALIQKRTEYGDRSFMFSTNDETKDDFIKRVKNCYITPYLNTDTPYYWEMEIYELGDKIY